jgi:hypothetical protein
MPGEQVIECGELRIIFYWCGDRYGHRIERLVGGNWTPSLMSVEGSAEDPWPQSPPLQTLHVEQRGSGTVALLVGRGGTSHWSASVEGLLDDRGFLFDIACRISRKPAQIGSRYRLLVSNAEHSIAVCVEPDEATATAVSNEGWWIVPVEEAESLPSTVRWRYQLRAAQ